MSDNTDKNAQFRQELDKKLKEIRELLFEWMKGWEEEKRRIFLFFAAISYQIRIKGRDLSISGPPMKTSGGTNEFRMVLKPIAALALD